MVLSSPFPSVPIEVMFRRRLSTLLAAAAGGNFKDPYLVLGVPRDAGVEDIKKAHKKLVLQYHPDSPTGDKEKFQDVQNAYEKLEAAEFKPIAPQPGEGPARQYTYDTPGSTKEPYVKGRDQALIRVVLLWSLGFVVIRYFMFVLMPPRRVVKPLAPAEAGVAPGLTAPPAANSSSLASSSIDRLTMQNQGSSGSSLFQDRPSPVQTFNMNPTTIPGDDSADTSVIFKKYDER
jgi:curved DNA-binding protein CbpA